jgi:hypothetical protein
MHSPVPSATPIETPYPEPTPEEAPPATPFPITGCFDSTPTLHYGNYDFKRSSDDPQGKEWSPHCLPRWMYGCFGAGAECEVLTPMPLQYGCGGVRARLAAPEADDETLPAIFDSPLASGRSRRRPALIGLSEH